MLTVLDDRQVPVLLGAFREVATGGGRFALTEADVRAIVSLAELGLERDAPDPGSLPRPTPDRLAATLTEGEQAATASQLLAIAALLDGSLDRARVDRASDFAIALDGSPEWLDELGRSLEPDLVPVILEMGDRNLRSVTNGQVDLDEVEDVDRWLMPYDGNGEDEMLTARYQVLGTLAPGSLGYEFWTFYRRHGFVLPGLPGAVNEVFATPHDCTHLLSGYDTTPQGELLVSTFTAWMHDVYPMEGHVLPVIYSWHLGIEFNKLAGHYRGALDPAKLWVAWDRGLQTSGDIFGVDFDFWQHVEDSVDEVREALGVGRLDPRHAAHSTAVAGVDYHPVA